MTYKHPFINLAASSVLAFLVLGCSKDEKIVQNEPAAVAHVAPPGSAPSENTGTAIKAAAAIPSVSAALPADEATSWAAIKDLTFDQRPAFLSGAATLESTLADQIAALNTKRAAMPSTTDTKDWDFAMKDLLVSQTYLRSTVDEVNRATPEIWQQEKDKVDDAWRKSEDAFDKVRTATTL
jgi:hypothetical protein